MKKLHVYFNLLLILFGTSISANAQHEGTLSKHDFTLNGCRVSSMTIKYKVNHFMGEPTVNGTYKWEAGSGTEKDCLPYSTTIWLKIERPAGGYGYVRMSPTVPNAGTGFGYNTTGSPNWDDFICGFDGSQKKQCFPESKAKTLYKEGYINDFTVTY